MLSAKAEIIKLLEKETGLKLSLDDIDYSPHADLASNVCFKLAEKVGKPPAEVAESLASKIKPSGFVARVEAKNGFLNFFLDYERFGAHVLEEAVKKDYGRGSSKKDKIILEHTSVNPSGPVHVGRLRNSIIGDSLRRILSYAGYPVETHYWVNDVGKQIAMIATVLFDSQKVAQAFKGRHFEYPILDKEYDYTKYVDTYLKYVKKDDFKILVYYVAANTLFENEEPFRKIVQELIYQAENGDKSSLEKIKKAANQCLRGQKQTYDRLGFHFDSFEYESEEVESGRVFKVLDKLKKSKYWTSKEDIGAGLDLSSFGIEKRSGLSVCQRIDDTTVYLSRDLSYHLWKLERDADVLINVLGEDHKLEFEELSTILTKILGVKKLLEVVHFSFVNFEGRQLSTRRGETLPVDLLLDEAEEKALFEIEERGIGAPETATEIGIGAVKYHIIKTAPTKPITFRWEEALSFEGDAAPYIQYAHARSARIIEKSEVSEKEISSNKADCSGLHDEERNVLLDLSRFPEVISKSAEERKPHLLANYVYELASSYSRFYKECPVLTGDEKLSVRRLKIVYAVKNTISFGLDLLGISSPTRM
ncbi:MAG: arginine--tRNA ligase [Methanobacteriota archaeon]